MHSFLVKAISGAQWLVLAFMIVFFVQCKEEAADQPRKDGFTPALNTKEDSLYHDVMQGHDVGMAKMSSLRKQSNHVTHVLDSLKKLPSAKVDESYKARLLSLQEELNYADQAMFTWMQEFNVDSAKSDKDKRIEYLESEKVKVEKVRDHILNSLRTADSLLKK